MKLSPQNKRAGCSRQKVGSLVVLLNVLLVSGCSHLVTDAGPPLSPPHARGIKPGVTTLSETLQELGPPQEISARADGVSFLYEHARAIENQIGLSLDASILKYFKFVAARASITHDTLILVFDSQNLLQAVGFSHTKSPLGKGGAVQILFTVTSLVDSSRFRQPSPAHQWGAAWLDPLPEQLNAAQSLEDGRFGFSSKPIFKPVGQKTLEGRLEIDSKNKRK